MTQPLDPHWGPHWVYRMYDDENALLYVGMTSSPANRLQVWKSTAGKSAGHWFDSATRVVWTFFDNKPDAAAEERRAVQAEAPRHNIRLRARPVRVCLVDGCVKPVAARAVCWTHYNRARTAGALDELYPRAAS